MTTKNATKTAATAAAEPKPPKPPKPEVANLRVGGTYVDGKRVAEKKSVKEESEGTNA